MWKITKPDVTKATNKDVRELARAEKLSNTVRSDLRQLYIEYDAQGGSVTDAQHATIPSSDATVIYDAYKKTYDGKPLAYIRSELMENVFKCPYCGISQPNTLDHYMPESQYGALSVCRLNLVPMCSACNTFKSAKPFDQFVHCYYEHFPDSVFLIAKVWVRKNRFVVRFDFDSAAIGDPALETKLRYQAKEIRLFKRVMKETTVFISTLCNQCEVTDTPSLKLWLTRRLAKDENTYGKNDWRCAVIRGILNYPKLDISIIQNYNAKPVDVSGGGI